MADGGTEEDADQAIGAKDSRQQRLAWLIQSLKAAMPEQTQARQGAGRPFRASCELLWPAGMRAIIHLRKPVAKAEQENPSADKHR